MWRSPVLVALFWAATDQASLILYSIGEPAVLSGCTRREIAAYVLWPAGKLSPPYSQPTLQHGVPFHCSATPSSIPHNVYALACKALVFATTVTVSCGNGTWTYPLPKQPEQSLHWFHNHFAILNRLKSSWFSWPYWGHFFLKISLLLLLPIMIPPCLLLYWAV